MTAFYVVLVTRSFAGCVGPSFFSSGGPYVFSCCVFDVISKTSSSSTSLLGSSFKTCLLLYFTLRLLIHVEFLFTFCFGTIVDSQEVVNKLYR